MRWVLNPCAHVLQCKAHRLATEGSARRRVAEFENLDIEYIDTTRQFKWLMHVMTKNLSPKVH